MTKRNPILVVALSFVTFTVYAYYWLYKTTDELKREADREDLSPILDVVLAVVTFGLWGLWAAYRNAKVAHELFEELGVRHTDRSLPVAAFGALSFVSGWAWLVSMALLQEDYKPPRRAPRGRGRGDPLRARPPGPRARGRAARAAGARGALALGGRPERARLRVERARPARVLRAGQRGRARAQASSKTYAMRAPYSIAVKATRWP
ncbi:MAG: DUF4234 domain-containing protein [Sandaracinaceae bacterium]|nr:DUF4234 domain-containing protein [Sandaracinaceae bacterium]